MRIDGKTYFDAYMLRIQRLGFLSIAGVMRITPFTGLEPILILVSICLEVKRQAVNDAHRFILLTRGRVNNHTALHEFRIVEGSSDLKRPLQTLQLKGFLQRKVCILSPCERPSQIRKSKRGLCNGLNKRPVYHGALPVY